MLIGLDIRMINFSGIGTTIRGLLDHLGNDRIKKLVLFGARDFENSTPAAFAEVPYPVYSLRQHLGYSRILNKFELSFFHMPHFDVPLNYSRPFVATIHDLIHVLFPQYSTKPFSKIYAKILLNHIANKAHRILTVSENTKKDILKFFPKAERKIKVIYPGVGEAFKPLQIESAQPVLEKYRLKPGYFLYVGNLRPSKNILGLIGSFLQFKKRNPHAPELVLVGKSFYKQFEGGIFPDGIRHIGQAGVGDLPALYSQALLFVFPSFYEGFGLPPIEAMACGTPCLVSRVASLPEICGDSSEYFNPLEENDILEKLENLWRDPIRLRELKVKGLENAKKFTWRKFADQTWAEYEKICQEIGAK